MEQLKIILYSDEHIYQQIHQIFTYYDEDNQIEYNYFNRDNYDVKHISTNRFINYSINNVSGYKHVSHVLLQKSFYRNRDIIKILRKFQYFNPEVKVLLIFDDDKYYYDYLLHIIAKEKLCSIAFSNDDIRKWFEYGCQNFNHGDLIIKKVKKKKIKEFLKY